MHDAAPIPTLVSYVQKCMHVKIKCFEDDDVTMYIANTHKTVTDKN